ncbi:oligopeptide ABC transporter permease [Clostridium folliculivorans]|uniref:Peptide ABC transporter permease n=1 Tax=Clostridium folliculivorans TaxID=2886038 RepID=A0A9W6DBH8_9CLOT|nr:oligopeptide ABC transporter permease [Clostridium folliculivorans]GKU26445.1 peptide ABC transporter permease [Clostridium folliculivorans]GKU32000.1 peptide ABC transporter permease [Clostridium folliculivorans]
MIKKEPKAKEVVNKKEKIESPWSLAWRNLRKNKLAMAGLYILLALIIFSYIGPWIDELIRGGGTTMLWEKSDLLNALADPTAQHPLGTDNLGRDVLARLMYGGRISLAVGVVAVSIEVIIGTALGIMAGYYGGIIDSLIMRFVDILLCFPFLPLLIMIGAVMMDMGINPKYKIYVVMIVIGVLSWPSLARLVRGQILSLREQEFMQAAEALGLKDRRKMFVHLLPNTLASIIVTATLGIGSAILTESALSFLGLGVTPPTPTWGNMIQAAQDSYALQFQPWLWMPPGICIFLTVMAINLFGDGLRDALDPKLKV